MPEKPLLSIVVPTRNEADNVTALWTQITKALEGVDFEVCFVDDSDDATPGLLADLEAANPDRVRCRFRHGADRAGGLATAVVGGIHLARGKYTCVMDADLQHPPSTIMAMLAAAEAGADLVVASRYTGGGSHHGLGGLTRRIVSRGSGLLARILFSEARRSSDPLAGFFLCRRELIDGIEFRPVGFKILLELLVCVPNLTVVDVPLDFAPRAGGVSKASIGQGVLFLRHLASLIFEVEGSARFWKFGSVGFSGLVLFSVLLWLGSNVVRIGTMPAFWMAFLPSVVWNTVLNRVWTFADIRRHRAADTDPWGYLVRAAGAGVITFAVFVGLTGSGIAVLPAGVSAALLAMIINGVTNYRATHRRPDLWAAVAADRSVTAALAQLAGRVNADRAYILPPRRTTTPADVPADLFGRVVTLRRGSLWTEAASHRPQRRTNIDVTSTLLVPVVDGGVLIGVVVLERSAPRGFSVADLATVTGAVAALVPVLIGVSTIPDEERFAGVARPTATKPE